MMTESPPTHSALTSLSIHPVNQVMELTDTSREAQERQALLLRKLEAEKRKRLLVVPTNPAEVVATLRSLRQPITLFGETVADRRERLRCVRTDERTERALRPSLPRFSLAPSLSVWVGMK